MVYYMILKQVLQLDCIFSRRHLDYQNIILYFGNKYACVCVCVSVCDRGRENVLLV